MAKFYGQIGYAMPEETVPGVWKDFVIERSYRGDVLQNQNRWESAEKVNDNLMIDNKLSIIGDHYFYKNMAHAKYVIWMGVKWKIKKIEILRPRLILTIGDVYNQ